MSLRLGNLNPAAFVCIPARVQEDRVVWFSTPKTPATPPPTIDPHFSPSKLQEEVSATLDRLGVGQAYVVCDGCELHYGMEASSASVHAGGHCVPLAATTFPSRPEVRTVQDEIDARSVAFEQGLQGLEAEAYIVAPCPMCLPGGPSVRLARSPLAGSPPCLFIASTPASVERGISRRPPAPSHSVAAHSGTYRLVAVIHVDVSGDHDHYFCQALYLDCWQLFDDRQQHNPRHLHKYTPVGLSTEAVFPSLMCYVREDHSKDDMILEMGRDEAHRSCSSACDEVSCEINACFALRSLKGERRTTLHRYFRNVLISS